MDRLLSGIQTTGKLTLGNYLGALKSFKELQDKYECFFMLADLHSLSSINSLSSKELRENTKKLLATYLAIGLDINKSTIFLQSQVMEHTLLQWILTSNTQIGELNRMTQYKDKSQKALNNAQSINAGLFIYPILMAADILLYDAKYVPVGEDQLQHIELTRTIATRFNSKYGDVFELPKAIIPRGARIKGLLNPTKKMSKTAENPKDCIFLDDEDDEIIKKIKSAKTDSDNKIKYDPINKAGISNLLIIYSELENISLDEALKKFENSNYANFKKCVADTVVKAISPIRKQVKEILNNEKYLEEILEVGRNKAQKVANKKIEEVKRKIGLI